MTTETWIEIHGGVLVTYGKTGPRAPTFIVNSQHIAGPWGGPGACYNRRSRGRHGIS